MSDRDRASPPRLARWLLARAVGADEEQVQTALAELWVVRVRKQGARSARVWYWRQVAGFVLRVWMFRHRRPARSSGGRMWGSGDRGMSERVAAWVRDGARVVRHAVRSLIRQPGFTALSVLTLALGIGSTTAMFGVLNGVVLRPLSYENADELVVVWPETVTNIRAVEWLAGETRSIGAMAAMSPADFSVTGDGPGDRVSGARVTTNYFDVMGVRFRLGRSFQADEAEPGRSNVAILGYGLWQSRYGGDVTMIGRTIHLDHVPYTVIGVLPRDFRPLEEHHQVWVPQAVERGTTVATDETWWMRTRIGRLSAGATVEGAQSEFRAAARRLANTFPEEIDAGGAERATVLPLRTALVGGYERTLWVLLCIVGLVLLIACSNVTNLLLARGEASQRDLALRTALGAGRRHLLVQLMAESLVLGIISGGIGLLLAWGGIRGFRIVAPSELPRANEVAIDGAVLLFALAVAVVTPFVFGLVPALRAARSDVRGILAEGSRGVGGSVRRVRLTAGLIASEIAMAVLVVTAAALLLRSLSNLRSVDPGFNADRVLTFQITVPPDPADPGSGPDMSVYRALWLNLAATPGVEAVGGIHILPLGTGNNRYPYWADDHSWPAGSPPPAANIRVATPGYVDAMGIERMEGRWFVDADRIESPPVVVINRTLAARLWPNESAVGKRIWLLDRASEPWQVVGVIGDVKQMGLARDANGEIYLPHDQWRWAAMFATLRTSVPPISLVPTVRRTVAQTDERITISRIAPMPAILRTSLATNEFVTGLTTVFAGLALALGIIGVYAVTTYAANRRLSEFGLRMALGSSPARIIESALTRDLRPVGLGLVIGFGAAGMTTRVLSSMLFGVEPFDLPIYLAVAAAVAAAATFASYVPTRRATKLDPMIVLRPQ